MPKLGKPHALKTGWPDVVYEWTAYGYTPARALRALPSADQIQRLDETLPLLFLLTRDQRLILWARAQGWTWRKIEDLDNEEHNGHGRQERQLRSILGDAEARVLAHLNGTKPRQVISI